MIFTQGLRAVTDRVVELIPPDFDRKIMMISVAVGVSGFVLAFLTQNTFPMIGFGLLSIVAGIGISLAEQVLDARRLGERIREMEADNEKIRLENKAGKENIEALRLTGNRFSQTVKEEGKQLSDLRNTYGKVYQEASSIGRTLKKRLSKEKDLLLELQKQGAAADEFTEAEEALSKELENSQAKIHDLEDQILHLQTSVASLKSEKEDFGKGVNELIILVSEHQKVPEHLKEELLMNQALADVVKGRIEEMERTYAELEQKTATKQREYDSLNERIAAANGQKR